MNKLAIVIPAYKATFLGAALDSIAAQTCKDFTLYIGDDCSPHKLWETVSKYTDRINIVYRRFDDNMGGTDLVGQWERCIAMTQDEPYIWLFSDDDVMEPRCVEALYKTIDNDMGRHDLYHFDIRIIDTAGRLIKDAKEYPNEIDNFSFYRNKMIGGMMSMVVENIFTRKIYEKNNGFKKFDLAWGSDTATWCVFGKRNGFVKIAGAKIMWRKSNENISPDKSLTISDRKMLALCDFYEWASSFFREHLLSCLYVNTRSFVNRMSTYSLYMSNDVYEECVNRFCAIHHISFFARALRLTIKINRAR